MPLTPEKQNIANNVKRETDKFAKQITVSTDLTSRDIHFDWYFPNFASNPNIPGNVSSNGLIYDEDISKDLLLDSNYQKNFLSLTRQYFNQTGLLTMHKDVDYPKVQAHLTRFTKIIQSYKILITLCSQDELRSNPAIGNFKEEIERVYEIVSSKIQRSNPSQYRKIFNTPDNTPKSIEQCFENDIDAMVFYDQGIVNNMKKRDLAKKVFSEDKANLKHHAIHKSTENIPFFKTTPEEIIYIPSTSPQYPKLEGALVKINQRITHNRSMDMDFSVTNNYLYQLGPNQKKVDRKLVFETLANILTVASAQCGLSKEDVKMAIDITRSGVEINTLTSNDFDKELLKKIQQFSATVQKYNEQVGIYSGNIYNSRQAGLRLAHINDDVLRVFEAKDTEQLYCQQYARKKIEIQTQKQTKLSRHFTNESLNLR